jgi:hypothetical protein
MFKKRPTIAYALSAIIAVLTVAACAAGLFTGLYQDTNSFYLAAWLNNDVVTLLFAVPTLIVSLILARRGSARAQLVWLGALQYVLYNYAFYVIGAALNVFFLVYVLLFVLAGWALIGALMQIDVGSVVGKFRAQTPTRWISGFVFGLGLVLMTLWGAQALAFIFTDYVPALGGETIGFKVTATLDLSLVVSLALPGAVWLWRRNPWGYVLAAIVCVKGVLYTLVLTGGDLYGLYLNLEGAGEFLPLWIVLNLGCLASLFFLLRNLQTGNEATSPAVAGARRPQFVA